MHHRTCIIARKTRKTAFERVFRAMMGCDCRRGIANLLEEHLGGVLVEAFALVA